MDVEPILNKTVFAGGTLKLKNNTINIGDQVRVSSKIYKAKKKASHQINTRDVRHTPTKHKFKEFYEIVEEETKVGTGKFNPDR